MPTEKHDPGVWMHPVRLPLGSGWKGYCTAPEHEGERPADEQLRDNCNVGYARNCAWCPQDRPWDAIRLGVTKESDQRIVLCYVREKDHRPVDHGTLEYQPALVRWTSTHPDPRVQRMAECYLEAFLVRKHASNELVTSSQE